MPGAPNSYWKDLLYRTNGIGGRSSQCGNVGPNIIPDTGCGYPWWGIPPYWPGVPPVLTPVPVPGPSITPGYDPLPTPGFDPSPKQPPGLHPSPVPVPGPSLTPSPVPVPPGSSIPGGQPPPPTPGLSPSPAPGGSAHPNPARARIGYRPHEAQAAVADTAWTQPNPGYLPNPTAEGYPTPGDAGHAEYVRGQRDGLRNTYNPAGTPLVKAYEAGFNEAQRASTMRLRNPFWQTGGSFDTNYPWVTPTVHQQNYPTPGMFFDANNPNGAFVFTDFESLITAALGSALSMAGGRVSLATDHSGAGDRLRQQLRDLIQCSRWNDSIYGTSNMGFVGGGDLLGPQGRGINWQPHHSDVFGTLSQNQAPVRTTAVDGRRLQQHMGANRLPLVWIPAVNLDRLAGPNPEVTVEGMQWTDGSSTIEPPPTVSDLSIQMSGVVLPGGPGCPPAITRQLNGRRMPGGAQAYWRQATPQMQPRGGKSKPKPKPKPGPAAHAALLKPYF